jgi:hypothetical protein
VKPASRTADARSDRSHPITGASEALSAISNPSRSREEPTGRLDRQQHRRSLKRGRASLQTLLDEPDYAVAMFLLP